jgi:hypothetical protein
MIPARKNPNKAFIPIFWVTAPQKRPKRQINVSDVPGSGIFLAFIREITELVNNLPAERQITVKPMVTPNSIIILTISIFAWTKNPKIRVKTNQPIMSLTESAEIIINPRSVFEIFKSCRALAAIGIALIVMTVAIKREKAILSAGFTK